ncbi:hypothetical protein P7C70_g3355, partial [Phenoliferia sp. Uapishka_3]
MTSPPPPGHLFFLEAGRGTVRTCRPDGTDLRTLASGYQGKTPDGIQVDVEHGHVYWTCMGTPSGNDGFIERCDLKDGGNVTTIVPPGKTHTPKQLQLDNVNKQLYWCDREGMRVQRCNYDGSSLEILISRGSPASPADETLHCVGIALDLSRSLFYWSQKGPSKGGKGSIYRAGLQVPKGETPSNRTDVETLFSGLPEPIDLQLDVKKQELYWTDRGAPPDGNSLNKAQVGENDFVGTYEILHREFEEAIGVGLDLKREKAYVADLGGAVYVMKLDGTREHTVFENAGNGITGIEFVDDE